MADDDQPLQHDLGEGVQALRSSGLLFALNEHVLHGQGFEARIDGERLIILGFGETPRAWDAEPAAVDQAWRTYRQTLLDAQKLNRPEYWRGHSPGFGQRGGGR